MRYRVDVSRHVAAKAAAFGEARSAEGKPSEYDFFRGPLAGAIDTFAIFDDLPAVPGPLTRSVTVIDPMFGPVSFVAVLVGAGHVEIADFEFDPEYWTHVDESDE